MPINPATAAIGIGLATLASIGSMERIAQRVEPPGRVHVLYWEKWTGTEYAGIKAAVDGFNRSQNRIYVDLLSESDIGNKTMFAASAGMPPDVAGLWGENVPQYADERAVEPLDKYCAEYGVKASGYIPCYWNMCTYDGHVYGLPSTPTSFALQYNEALVRKAGLDPDKPPKTIEELDAMSDKIVKRKNGHLEVAGFLPTEPGWSMWVYPSYFGGGLYDGHGHLTADRPENVRAFDWVQSYPKKLGATAINNFQKGFGGFDSPQNSFLMGQVAMELHGVWLQMYRARFAPNLKIKVAPFPPPADRPDCAGVVGVGMDIMVIPRGARHPREAFEFMKYVQTQHVMELLCQSHGTNSPLAHSSEWFFRTHPNPDIRLFDKLAKSPGAVSPPRIGIWAEYSADLSAAFDRINLLQQTPKQALGECQRRMQPRFELYMQRLAMRRAQGL
ncbi:MAG: ABC transporter substrate-binding protein [Fimbriimonadaceae bacterium]